MADLRTFSLLSGRDLATFRRAMGLTQTELAQAADLTRYSVSRWEQKALIDVGQDTPKRLLEVLMICGRVRLRDAIARGRGDGVLLKLQQRVLRAQWEAQ